MKQFVISYYEIGDKGELVHHKEVFFTRLAARINFWFSQRNKRRVHLYLTETEV